LYYRECHYTTATYRLITIRNVAPTAATGLQYY